MIDFIEKQFDITHEQQEYLDFVQGSYFPLYMQDTGTGYKVLGHNLMRKNEDSKPVTGTINSPNYPLCEALFLKFCKENNIKVKNILRMSINSTGYSTDVYTGIHVDHDDFEHWNFLLYLNDCAGNTLIFDDANNIIKEIEPKKNKAVIFKGLPHANRFCANNEWRYVLVATFIKDET